jgi:TctA family transporter
VSEVSQRAKTGIVILGVLAGLALVILPGIAAPSRVAPSSDGSRFYALFSTPASSESSPSQAPGTNLQTVAIGLLFTVIPAGAFSLYMRRWAIRRAKAYWPETEN